MWRFLILLPLVVASVSSSRLRVPDDPSYADEIRLNRKALEYLQGFVKNNSSNGDMTNSHYFAFFTQVLLEKMRREREKLDRPMFKPLGQIYDDTFDALLHATADEKVLQEEVNNAETTIKYTKKALGKLDLFEKKYCSHGEPKSSCELQLREAFRAETGRCRNFVYALELSDRAAKAHRELEKHIKELSGIIKQHTVLAFLSESKKNLKPLLTRLYDSYYLLHSRKFDCDDVRSA